LLDDNSDDPSDPKAQLIKELHMLWGGMERRVPKEWAAAMSLDEHGPDADGNNVRGLVENPPVTESDILPKHEERRSGTQTVPAQSAGALQSY
jgi:hypothetical protein